MIGELGSSMQASQHRFQGGYMLSRDSFRGDTPPVIGYSNAVIFMDGYFDMVTAASHGFVYAVVHYLVEDLVQSVTISAANIHAWA
jgi:hypothetical protein